MAIGLFGANAFAWLNTQTLTLYLSILFFILLGLAFLAAFFFMFLVYNIKADIKKINGRSVVCLTRPARIVRDKKGGHTTLRFLWGYPEMQCPDESHFSVNKGIRKQKIDLWADGSRTLHPIPFSAPEAADGVTKFTPEPQNAKLFHTMMTRRNTEAFKPKVAWWQEHLGMILNFGLFAVHVVVIIIELQMAKDVALSSASAGNALATAISGMSAPAGIVG